MTTQLRLRDDVRLDVDYDDATLLGSAVTGRCDALLRRVCRQSVERTRGLGAAQRSVDVLTECLDRKPLRGLFAAPDRLFEAVVYPRYDAVVPVGLRVTHQRSHDRSRTLALPRSIIANLAQWLGEWAHPSVAPRHPSARALFCALRDAGAMTTEATPCAEYQDGVTVTMVGHATVAVQHDGTRVLFDPFLLPVPGSASYRPLSAHQVAPDAVFITHAHPDHYDLGSLVRWGADTPIYVPRISRESLLSIDMRARLSELGFRRVNEMDWGDVVSVGSHRVRACPFFGEQPTDRDFLHPQVRNMGNTYVVHSGARSFAVIADAGRDHAGDTRAMATELHAAHGPVDAVFGGYRAWRLHPAELLTSSVARYALFVPRVHWGQRMQLMNDADDLLEVGSRWGATHVVPYANGGAPWFWEAGLGPRLDPQTGVDDADFDPDLRPVAQAYARRKRAGLRPPAVSVMHPGDLLRWTASGAHVQTAPHPDHRWPYPTGGRLFAAHRAA